MIAILGCLVGLAMASAALAQAPRSRVDMAAAQGVPEFRDPKTGRSDPLLLAIAQTLGKPVADLDNIFDWQPPYEKGYAEDAALVPCPYRKPQPSPCPYCRRHRSRVLSRLRSLP
jgi:hypothetical protein